MLFTSSNDKDMKETTKTGAEELNSIFHVNSASNITFSELENVVAQAILDNKVSYDVIRNGLYQMTLVGGSIG